MVNSPNKLSKFWQELRRRKVLPFVIGYIAACFAIIEFMRGASETFSVSKVTIELLYILAAIGIPIVIVLPWFINRKKALARTDLPGEIESSVKSDTPYIQDKSIIVLPFENISPDPEQEYFSDGLTEEIISDLSHIHDLLVISRSSAMTFKGTKKKIKEIAGDVKVRYVLEGSVRKSENNLRITAQLIDASNDSHLWADKYNGILEDIFDIQEKVSHSIVEALKIKLSADEKNLLAQQKINDAMAFEQYLLARHEIWRFTDESLSHAIQLLNSNMKAVGRNEYLLTALGYAYFQYVNAGIDPDIKHLDTAERLINEALSLNPELSKAYYIKSLIHEERGELHDAFKAIKEALIFDPADSEALSMIAYMHALVGKPDGGIQYAKRAIEIDPLYPFVYCGEWWVHQSAGSFDKASETCSRMYHMDQDNPLSIMAYAYTSACNKDIDKATQLFDSLILKYPDQAITSLGKALRHAFNNEIKEAVESIDERLEKKAALEHTFAWFLADVYSLIGEKDKAIDYLESATRDIFIDYPFFSKYDPFLENIREEERFKALMVKVRQKWENFKV